MDDFMNIKTLDQAANHLISSGVVDFNTMTVEGKQLLEVCGYEFGKDQKKFLDRIVARHEFEINKDFTIDIVVDGNIKRNVYHFTMNAANHILLAAMTDKGKEARQEAIDLKVAVDSVPVEMVEQMMASLADRLTARAGGEIARLASAYDSKIHEKDLLIIKKSEPLSLTKILGNSHKVVQAANLWLEENGYQNVHFKNGKRNGWTIGDKGRELGAQVSDSSIFWIPEVKQVLPSVSELLCYAERLGLRDMKQRELI